MDGKIIIFSAPSGSGKTTILKTLIQSDELQLAFSISATSRQQRENEEEGKDYYFFSPERFKEGIANEDFLEWEEVYENQFYGTLKSEIDRLHTLKKNVVFDVDVLGGLNLKRFFGKRALAVFIMPPSMEVLEERLRGRGTETEETLGKRLKKAAYELSFSDKFDYILINDKLEESISTAHQVIFNFLNQHKY